MIRNTLTRTALVLTLTCLALAACERKSAAPPAPAILSSEDSILRFIPADSPYVVVNPEPIDDDLFAKITGDAFRFSKGYEAAMRDALERDVDEYPDDSEERVRA